MERIEFEKLLLKTAFCCLASDGNIDQREIDLIKDIFSGYEQYQDVNFNEKINSFIKIYNEKGKDFFTFYFDILKEEKLSLEEEMEIIDIAIQTIQADELIEYSEIKFFKLIRHHLQSSDEQILDKFPDIQMFLEKDIVAESYFEKISKQFFTSVEFVQFDKIELDDLKMD